MIFNLASQEFVLNNDNPKQGEVITIYSNDTNDHFIVKIVDNKNKTLLNSNSFLYYYNKSVYYTALISIPPDFISKAYELKIISNNKNIVKKIKVLENKFNKREIPLDKKMTTLRENNTKERISQSKSLTEILYTVNMKSVFLFSKLIHPLENLEKTAFFGDKRIYLYNDGTKKNHIHTGVDYRAKIGTQIFVSGDGRVVLAKNRIITGNTVVIEHLPGVYTLYYHLSSLNVSTGQIIKKGTVLGLSGDTGLVTGPHLHWELRINGICAEPEVFFTKPLISINN